MDLGLKDKVALVTGVSAGRGALGQAVAAEFAAEGARLVISAYAEAPLRRVAHALEKEYGTPVLPVAADLTRAQGVAALVEAALAAFGRIDILVNSAGNLSAAQVGAAPADAFEQGWALKPLGYVRLSRAVLPLMAKQGGGRIINLCGLSGREPGRRRSEQASPAYRAASPAYPGGRGSATGGMANAAVLNFTKALAVEAAPHNILVNAINPSYTRDGLAGFLAPVAAQTQRSLDDLVQEREAQLLLGRAGEAADIAAMAAFLASRRAGYITGAVMDVDGGERHGY